MRKVTDPNLLSQLESGEVSGPRKVTDPNILSQLEGGQPQKGLLRRSAEAVIESPALPIAGGIAGGMMGAGVASIPLAGVGAAGGEAYRQLIARKMGLESPQTPEESAKGIGVQGGTAMLGEGVGRYAIKPLFQKAAVPMARKALGFTKRFLNTPFARGQAQGAAKVALEEGIIPLSGSPSTMMSRAESLKSAAGERIGKVLESTSGDISQAEYDLELLRQRITKGTKEGVFSKANSAIDDVKSTLLDLYGRGKEVTAKSLTDVKTRIGNSINYLSDLASQSDNKAIVSTLGNTVRNLVKAVQSPEVYSKFAGDQKLYNAYSLMVKGLNNELAAQMGNKIISPYSVIAGAGQLAAGQTGQAAATVGLTEGLMRRGAGTGARMLFSGGKAVPALSQAATQATSKSLMKNKKINPVMQPSGNGTKRFMNVLPSDKAVEYLQRAGGNKEKAREMALNDGWRLQ